MSPISSQASRFGTKSVSFDNPISSEKPFLKDEKPSKCGSTSTHSSTRSSVAGSSLRDPSKGPWLTDLDPSEYPANVEEADLESKDCPDQATSHDSFGTLSYPVAPSLMSSEPERPSFARLQPTASKRSSPYSDTSISKRRDSPSHSSVQEGNQEGRFLKPCGSDIGHADFELARCIAARALAETPEDDDKTGGMES